ncbi:diacylglycerol kinase family protein [uncultured Corynebacterium sp.]|uniref:diacylglycerol/lipid kinase family protein n=1 Tax=uncultured Corynebacterium sp. TaxID=159447 RepID=UPI0026004E4B|nr:diacylglycerol kinase family protein [uncultured Corynebacterium sp.]
MRALLIANPNSTTQDAVVMRHVYPYLAALDGLEVLVKFTHYAGHAAELVRGVTRKEWDAVIAVGGDGTVNEVVNGLLGKPGSRAADPATLPVLGVIPTGSANVFARALGFPGQPADAARVLAETMYYDLRRTVRLGTWEGESADVHTTEWFAVNAGFGLDADILTSVDRQRAKGRSATPLRYLVTTLRGWRRALIDPPSLDVEAHDGERHLRLHGVELLLASNTNPWTFLGPLPVVTNPRNSFDEGLGLFGLHRLHGPSGFAGLLHLFGAYRLSRKQVIQFDDAQSVVLTVPHSHSFQADGEVEGSYTRVELRSVPDALEVYAP